MKRLTALVLLAATLFPAFASTTSDDVLRTKHRLADGSPQFTNRLSRESSPYLLQHAHNPVDWYPWGEEAFKAAQQQDKPILLSIGYSTCHWCHVMEDESFDNLEIAAYINEHYIAIKVDREERPDVDRTYMAAVEAFSGRSGWPMTVWLTPGSQPFFGGTYMPPYDGDRGIDQGFLTHLKMLKKAWSDNRGEVDRISLRLATAARARLTPQAGDSLPGDDVFERAFGIYKDSFDPRHGGLTTVPKFASHLPVRFLMRYYLNSGDEEALRMVQKTLVSMADGGLFDQVGGGFHRYSTDASWGVPHFEKMLYDNALLAIAYLEAYQLTGNDRFGLIARETLRYAQRDMRAPGGAFYSASDADSRSDEGELVEGWFYTWSAKELADVLTGPELDTVLSCYATTESGDLDGRNVLRRAKPVEGCADRLLLIRANEILYEARSKRAEPFVDTKILTSWNGLMISAFARAATVFGESDYLDVASSAAHFILENMQDNDGLLRSYLNDRASGQAFADDYAYFIQALLDLYEASGVVDWFRHASRLQEQMDLRFTDGDGGFFFAPASGEALFAREKPVYDGTLPAASSVAVLNLLRLHEFTTDDAYRQRAEAAVRFGGDAVSRSPAGAPEFLNALDFYTGQAKAIVLVTPGERRDAEPFLHVLRSTFLPNHVLIVVEEGDMLEEHAKQIRLLEGKYAMHGKTTAYVCVHGVCDLPTNDPVVFEEQIRVDEQ